MKRILPVLFAFVVFGFFASPAVSSASEYASVLAKNSPLVPAAKPFRTQNSFQQTNVFKGMKNYTDRLASHLNKKVPYSKARIASSRGTINASLERSWNAIKSHKEAAAKRIENLAKARSEALYDAAATDRDASLVAANRNYKKNFNQATKAKNQNLKKVRTIYRKKQNKKFKNQAKKKAFNKKARANLNRSIRKINQRNNKRQKALSNRLLASVNRSNATYNEQIAEAQTLVSREQELSIQALNNRTQNELKIRKAQRDRAFLVLKRLNKNNNPGQVGSNKNLSKEKAKKINKPKPASGGSGSGGGNSGGGSGGGGNSGGGSGGGGGGKKALKPAQINKLAKKACTVGRIYKKTKNSKKRTQREAKASLQKINKNKKRDCFV